MLIGSHYTLSHINNNFSVKVNNTQMDRVVKHKYLGVHIDETLKWHAHVKVITKKISAGLAVLKSIRPFILFDTGMSMYNALVMPCFNYCSTVWENIGIGLADKILKLQNRAARILTFRGTLKCALDELGWERLETSRLNNLLSACTRCIIIIFPRHT